MKIAALVLAGGRGARLRPFTWFIPKVMLPLGRGKRVIDLTLESIRTPPENVDCHSYVLAGYKADQLVRYLGAEKGVTVLQEPHALGTGGAINFHWHTIQTFSPDLILVLCGDHRISLNLDALLRDHVIHGLRMTVIAARSSESRHHYLSTHGNVVVDIVSVRDRTTNLAFTGNVLIHFKVLNAKIPELTLPESGDFVQSVLIPLVKREGAAYHLLTSSWDDLGTWGRYLRYRLQATP